MSKFLIANWKMNLPILSEWSEAIKSSTPPFYKKGRGGPELVVCPPFTHINQLSALLKGSKIKLGAQDVFWEEKGAYTGEVSPIMLKNLGVEYAIIGHSERRRHLHETDEMINKKVAAALKAGLKVILCVGEPAGVRNRGLNAAKKFIKSQLQKDLSGIENCKLKIENLAIAYEPIWAIGTGRADTPKQTVEIIKFVRRILNSKFKIQNSKLLYGGSVTSQNVVDFLKYQEIDGALIGGASLKVEEFRKMINLVSRL